MKPKLFVANMKELGLTNTHKQYFVDFLRNLESIFAVYLDKDAQYQHAWRNMPWQSCIIRAREKMLRLLTMENASQMDLFEEGGDSINYILFSMHQMRYGFTTDPSSKKATLIQNYLNMIQMVIDTDEENLVNIESHAPLDTWINFDKNKMTTEEVIHELKQGVNVRVGSIMLIGNENAVDHKYIMVDGEGKVVGWWNPFSGDSVALYNSKIQQILENEIKPAEGIGDEEE